MSIAAMVDLRDVRLKAPLDVQFDITRKCQLDCSYCCATPLDGHNANTERAISLIQELGRDGVVSLLLSGGEAMLHPDFYSILAAADDQIPMISFGTNGIRLSNSTVARRVKQTAPRVMVTVSLDSLEPSVHDLNRGYGGEKAKIAIENACDAGIQVSISCVLTDHNVDTADEIVERYFPAVSKFAFFPRVSRAQSEKFSDFSSFSRKMASLTEKLERMAKRDKRLDIMLPVSKIAGACAGAAFVERSSCSCHRTKAYITSDMNVYPCYYGASKSSYLGNVNTQNFSHVWRGRRSDSVYAMAERQSLCGMRFLQDVVPRRFMQTVYGDQNTDTSII